ncbi:MAG: efflux RND transporter periplasmic adaptor subunit [Desulfurella sp.]|uniref:efflux RND transporter periplasmic adaptor subunit n=1 Tax=Desulfurella sp. TaxID=1962857 RepID=UPI000CACAB10|nr:efflux RND transporter periplasmic adaptor subunit [Desulfurella sp.]PMP88570.1 MAG: hypothetical protein C0173_06995 [Desulfurella sp.]
MKKIVLLIIAIVIANYYTLAKAVEVKIGYPKTCTGYEKIKAYGKVQTTQNITIFAPVSGIIKIDSNFSTVKSGQLIARIYPPNLSKQIENAKLNVDAAYTNLQNTIELKNIHIATAQEIEKAKILYYQAKSNLERLSAQIEKSKIYAPFSGSLEFLVPNQTYVILNQPIANLAGNTNLWIKAYVSPDYIDKLKIDQIVYYYSHNIKHKGSIAQIEHNADVSGLVPIFINTNNKALIAGQWVNLEIPVIKNTQFCVPKSAIVSKDSKTYVFIVKDNVVYQKQVNLINISNNTAYINGNLNKNEPLAISATDRLKNNIKVKIIK